MIIWRILYRNNVKNKQVILVTKLLLEAVIEI